MFRIGRHYTIFRKIVTKKYGNTTLEDFLVKHIDYLTEDQAADYIRKNKVFINGKSLPYYSLLKPEDAITGIFKKSDQEFDIIPEDISLDILYEDQHIVLIDKPAGMVVHPGPGHWSGSLVNGLVYRYKNLPTLQYGEDKPGLVHRIDMDTSGVLVCCKTQLAMDKLAEQFRNHTVHRIYHAVVLGAIEKDQETIDRPIGRSHMDYRKRQVFDSYSKMGAKYAVTHYWKEYSSRKASYIRCSLDTGRTHQIRVHLHSIGHPLVQDKLYLPMNHFQTQNNNDLGRYINRQALHAATLGFDHPATGKRMKVESPLPKDFLELVSKI
jgi:23S rRNA pseudouridine1911/1915/1917 synthase